MKHKNKTLAIFTLVEHKTVNNKVYGYGPYITEMNMWTSHFDRVIVVGYYSQSKALNNLDLAYEHDNIELVPLPKFNIKTVISFLKLLVILPSIVYKIGRVMTRSDYFHFRCPSNVSAIAAVIQIFFPRKPKSTRYAGNWDPKSSQPLGYRFQKWILSNTVFTKKMKLLVYGNWPSTSPYIYPFFAATYFDNEKVDYEEKDFSRTLKFVFIGALVPGKRPKLTIDIVKKLVELGYKVKLHVFGEGILMKKLKNYVIDNKLESLIVFHGNQNKGVIKSNLQDAHFTILPSKSEGWPKAIAEGMFYGAIPISTKISCVPWMLGFGERGILIEPDVNLAVKEITKKIQLGFADLNGIANKALIWSQQYTMDKLKLEIEKVIQDPY